MPTDRAQIAKPAAIPHEVTVLRESAVVPRSAAEADLAGTTYSELARLAAGHGLQLGGSAWNQDDGRQVVGAGACGAGASSEPARLAVTLLRSYPGGRRVPSDLSHAVAADLARRQAAYRAMEAYRARKRRNAVLVSVEVEATTVAALQRIGLLDQGDRDPDAIASAVAQFLLTATPVAAIGDALFPAPDDIA